MNCRHGVEESVVGRSLRATQDYHSLAMPMPPPPSAVLGPAAVVCAVLASSAPDPVAKDTTVTQLVSYMPMRCEVEHLAQKVYLGDKLTDRICCLSKFNVDTVQHILPTLTFRCWANSGLCSVGCNIRQCRMRCCSQSQTAF